MATRKMAWARLDDGFGDHQKVLDLIDTLPELEGAAALGLWTLALAYAHGTMRLAKAPGFIPRSFARSRARVPAQLGDRLVAVGLWEEADGGWLIHDFDDYLPSQELRAKRAEAGRQGARARWEKKAAAQQGDAPAGEGETAGADSNLPSEAIMANGKSCPEPEPEPIKKKTSSSSSPAKRGMRIPDDFAMTPEMIAWGRENFPDLDGKAVTAEFVDYWRAVPGAKGIKLDWTATWRNWVRRKGENGGPGAFRNGRSPTPTSPRPSTTDQRVAQALAAAEQVKADLRARRAS